MATDNHYTNRPRTPDFHSLTKTDYSDSTPDITTTYTRLGQKKTVTDATGTRTFAYSPTTLQPETETLDDTFFSSANLLTRS